MRYLCTLFLLIFALTTINAQVDTVPISPYSAKFDSSHFPLISGTVPYNRLYDMVFPWASLDMTASGDTTDFNRFRQGWYELI